ncbi:3221_t:CDS:1, partial [Funneliformis geosporum]
THKFLHSELIEFYNNINDIKDTFLNKKEEEVNDITASLKNNKTADKITKKSEIDVDLTLSTLQDKNKQLKVASASNEKYGKDESFDTLENVLSHNDNQ